MARTRLREKHTLSNNQPQLELESYDVAKNNIILPYPITAHFTSKSRRGNR